MQCAQSSICIVRSFFISQEHLPLSFAKPDGEKNKFAEWNSLQFALLRPERSKPRARFESPARAGTIFLGFNGEHINELVP